MDNLENKIEAILFFKGEPVAIKKLADILKVDIEQVKENLEKLKSSLGSRGIVLLELDGEVSLGTSPEYGDLIENLQKEELNKDLSKATLDTLSIILYKNGASRAEIDYIRGVNSTFSLRALSIRGLIEKTVDPKDSRKYLYKPSIETLSFMGVASVEELPGYGELKAEMDKGANELAELSAKEENKNAEGNPEIQ